MPDNRSERFDRVMASARMADRVAAAFLPAYRAALQALVPSLQGASAVLCVTEEGGNHPRAIQTTLQGGRLNGEKAWSTGAEQGQVFLVCARDGDAAPRADGRPQLVLIRVASGAPGVTVTPMPPTPFVPEVGHCRVGLSNVAVEPSQRLPGDGYADYVKPFRTVEDIWVHAALTAFLLGVGERSGWSGGVLARLHAQLAGYRDLVGRDPRAPETHLALAGLFAQQSTLIDDLTPMWSAVEPETASRWRRDRALLRVASGARRLRDERALVALGLAAEEN